MLNGLLLMQAVVLTAAVITIILVACSDGYNTGKREGDREGFKRGWIAGIDYEKNHKDGV